MVEGGQRIGCKSRMSDSLNTILNEFKSAFRADGFDLELGDVQSGRVEVRVVHGADSCEDCLMPDDRLCGMFLTAFKKIAPDVVAVVVRHEGKN